MNIISNNKIINIKEYINFKDKLMGLMFKKNLNYGILLKNCSSIHTFFCFIPLDIIVLDKNLNIIDKKTIKKNKIYISKKGKHIIEVPHNLIDLNNFKID